MTDYQRVIFFDGLCGLCNGFVDFILKIDHEAKFKFSPLQSEYAKAHLPAEYILDLKTVIVQIDGENLRKAPAVMAIFKEIGGIWGVLSLISALPAPFLNIFYDMVAENRYQIFGKKDSCRLPTPTEKTRFLL